MSVPKLVDYSLFKKKKKIIRVNYQYNNYLLINFVCILLLILIGIGLYYRYNDKVSIKEKKEGSIILLNEYVKDYIKNNK